MTLRIKVDLRDVAAKLGLLRANLKLALLQGIAEGIFQMARRSFDQQASPEGAPWVPLSPRYAGLKARLFPRKPILQAHGILLRSLFRGVEGDQAIIGSSLPYAAIHQFGGAAGRRGPFKKKGGKRAQIPARPFMPQLATAEAEAVRLAEEILEQAVRNAELQ